MKFWTIIFVVLAIVNYNLALKCYLCGGSLESNCAKADNSSMMENYCEYIPGYKYHCVDYVVKANEDYSKGFARGCGYMPEDETRDVCDFMKEAGFTNGNCEACYTDFCNGHITA